jgi:hypothetical protein
LIAAKAAEDGMRGIGIVLALGLAGCGGITDYPWEGPTGGGKGLPVVAMQSSRDVVVPPGRGKPLALAVRAFVPGAEGWQEVTGARCRVTGGEFFGAELVAPARLVVPDLGPDAPVLRAECTGAGTAGAAAVAPAFGWPEEGRPAAVHRIWWGGGWWRGFQKTGPMRYPDLAVGMRQAAPG